MAREVEMIDWRDDPVLATVSPVEVAAMDRALELAGRGPAHGPNPRVGCVLLGPDGRRIAEGWHAGAGTPHAEVAAIAEAGRSGADLSGATAVVTLEPCSHTGRTGPCTGALLAAGVTRVVFAVDDPNPVASGGAERLRSGRVDVVGGVRRAEGMDLVRVWHHAVTTGRPFVTLKLATSLDGRVAAADGTSRWITSSASRAHAHGVRATVDAVVVGTGTALTDDPTLTARTPDGGLAAHQPLRVVVGRRPLPAGARLRGPGGELVTLAGHDVAALLADLAGREVRHVLVEGGPTLAAAVLRAGVVDEVHAYVAPVLLGSGPSAVADLGVGTIDDAVRLDTVRTEQVGPDLLLVARPVRRGAGRPSEET
ncbi:MAG: ribD [Actinotalea sp.]|nr:ribD [Actinotalea sp.]